MSKSEPLLLLGRAKRGLATFLTGLLLSACSLGTPTPDAALYTLHAPAPPATAHGKPLAGSLAIAMPILAPGLDSERIALLHGAQQFDYYAGAKWADHLPSLLQSLTVKTLEDTGLASSVNTSGSGIMADYELVTEWRDFQAEYTGDIKTPPTVHARLSATLIHRVGRKPVRTLLLEQRSTASDNTLAATLHAFDNATGALLGELAAQLGG